MLIFNLKNNLIVKFRWWFKEYFKSPFIWWGIAFVILENLDEFLVPVHQFRLLLWVNELNMIFFIPVTFMAISIVMMPYRHGLILMIKNKQNIGFSLLSYGSIIISFITEGVLYRFGIVTIIGNQFKETVVDQVIFEQLGLIGYLMTFFFVPIVIIRIQLIIKNEFIKKKIKIYPIKWDEIIVRYWLLFIFLLIGFWVVNILINKTLTC